MLFFHTHVPLSTQITQEKITEYKLAFLTLSVFLIRSRPVNHWKYIRTLRKNNQSIESTETSRWTTQNVTKMLMLFIQYMLLHNSSKPITFYLVNHRKWLKYRPKMMIINVALKFKSNCNLSTASLWTSNAIT